jgi:hypothetical protein
MNSREGLVWAPRVRAEQGIWRSRSFVPLGISLVGSRGWAIFVHARFFEVEDSKAWESQFLDEVGLGLVSLWTVILHSESRSI